MLFSDRRWHKVLALIVLSAFFIGVTYPSQTPTGRLLAALVIGGGVNYALLPLIGLAQAGGRLVDYGPRAALLIIRVLLVGAFVLWVTPTADVSMVDLGLGLALGVLLYCLAQSGLDALRRHGILRH